MKKYAMVAALVAAMVGSASAEEFWITLDEGLKVMKSVGVQSNFRMVVSRYPSGTWTSIFDCSTNRTMMIASVVVKDGKVVEELNAAAAWRPVTVGSKGHLTMEFACAVRQQGARS